MAEIPTSDWTWINAAADRFERDWKQGQRPMIESYLAEVHESQLPRSWKNCSTSKLSCAAAPATIPPAEYAARFLELRR